MLLLPLLALLGSFPECWEATQAKIEIRSGHFSDGYSCMLFVARASEVVDPSLVVILT